jgi:hypothetical protein
MAKPKIEWTVLDVQYGDESFTDLIAILFALLEHAVPDLRNPQQTTRDQKKE